MENQFNPETSQHSRPPDEFQLGDIKVEFSSAQQLGIEVTDQHIDADCYSRPESDPRYWGWL